MLKREREGIHGFVLPVVRDFVDQAHCYVCSLSGIKSLAFDLFLVLKCDARALPDFACCKRTSEDGGVGALSRQLGRRSATEGGAKATRADRAASQEQS